MNSLITPLNCSHSRGFEGDLLSKIKKQISCFSPYGREKDPEKIYAKVFNNFEFLENEKIEVVHLILSEGMSANSSIALMGIFLHKYPDYQLTPFQKVLYAILLDVKESNYNLNYSSLISLIQEEDCFNLENVNACLDLAFKLNHHRISEPSDCVVKANEYVINFLWINLDAQDRNVNNAKHVFGNGDDEVLQNEFMQKVSVWIDDHPQVDVNIWIDSALVTCDAAKNTLDKMRSLSCEKGINLTLCDVRSIDYVKNSMQRYFHPAIPVYFRVDLAKALIADHMMKQQSSYQYVVISDIDITSQPKDELFDKRSLKFLEDFGYVFNRCGMDNFENSFSIFKTGNENLINIHEQTVLLSLDRMMSMVEECGIQAQLRPEHVFSSQSVFKKYTKFRDKTEFSFLSIFDIRCPRKVVQTPESQFNFGGKFSRDYLDHRNEEFRFTRFNEEIPYVKMGRSQSRYDYVQIEKYLKWTPISIEF